MLKFDVPENEGPIIKVVGVGGAGGNAVKHMANNGIKNVEFIICNTDYQDLLNSPIENKIQLGPELTEGLGAGSKPDIGRQAALETTSEIETAVRGAEMVFVTAGMGGGTGTGAAPIVAKVCKDMGILTVGIVTIPFKDEGLRRLRHACRGLEELVPNVDSLLVVNNQRIIDIFGDLGFSESFAKADDVLATATRGIAEIVDVTGYMNVQLSNVQAIMRNSGLALMGSGQAGGTNRAIEALENALHSPLLNNNNVFGARSVLISIYSSSSHEVTPKEITAVHQAMQDFSGNNADIIPGSAIDESLGEEVSITIVATGFDKSGLEQYVFGDLEHQELINMQEEIYRPINSKYLATAQVDDNYRSYNPQSNNRDFVLEDNYEAEVQDKEGQIDFHSVDDQVLANLENVPAYMRRRKNMKRRTDNSGSILSNKGVVNSADNNTPVVTENRYLNRNED